MDKQIKPQIVTGLFDIGRGNWKYHTTQIGGYLHWFENLLAIDCPMVIYTQPQFVDKINEHRDPSNTKVITMEVEQLTAYNKYYSQLERLMLSEEFKSFKSFNVPEMLYPLYNVIMFNKMYWIKDAIDNKYFDSNITIWADAGMLRDPYNENYNVKWPNTSKLNLDRITYFSHHEQISIHNIKDHAMSQMRFIQGTSFSVPNDFGDLLVLSIESVIQKCIDEGYIGSDEKMFDIAYLKQPWDYKLIKSGWRETFRIWS